MFAWICKGCNRCVAGGHGDTGPAVAPGDQQGHGQTTPAILPYSTVGISDFFVNPENLGIRI